jgi:hypothetical protein
MIVLQSKEIIFAVHHAIKEDGSDTGKGGMKGRHLQQNSQFRE